MMAPAITAPPTMPAAMPGPHPHPPPCHPHPRPRHCAEASVAVAARVATIVAATTKIVSIFFIVASLAWQAPNEQNWRYAVGKVIPLFVGIWPAHGIEVPLYYSAGGPIETTCRHRARENEQRGR